MAAPETLKERMWDDHWDRNEKGGRQEGLIWLTRPEDHRSLLHERVPQDYALRSEVGNLGFRRDDLPQPPRGDTFRLAPAPAPSGDEEESQ